jgi:hypothetical protein
MMVVSVAVFRTLRLTLAAIALLAPAAGAAGPRTIDDCEKIKEAEAFNLCLAAFGPTRGQHNKTYPGMAGGSGAAASTETRGRRSARRWRGDGGAHGAARPGHGGRVRMEFTPGR